MELQWPKIRRVTLELSRPALHLIGKFHVPPHYRSITMHEAGQLKLKILPGDVLLSHRNYEITNPLIPGYWKHAAIYIGNGKVLEAIGKGVIVTDLDEFVTTKDGVVCLRAKFATSVEAELAAGFAMTLEGLPYDFLVEHDFSRAVNIAFYCSEIPWWCYEQVFTAAGKILPFRPKATMGVPTVAPMDYRLATDTWQQVMILRGEGH